MVRTSPTDKEYTEYELETMDIIATLTRMPGFKRLGDVVKVERDKYVANLARGLASSPAPVDQREIDFKRGFWQGAVWAIQALPHRKSAEWDKFVNAAAKDGEDAE